LRCASTTWSASAAPTTSSNTKRSAGNSELRGGQEGATFPGPTGCCSRRRPYEPTLQQRGNCGPASNPLEILGLRSLRTSPGAGRPRTRVCVSPASPPSSPDRARAEPLSTPGQSSRAKQVGPSRDLASPNWPAATNTCAWSSRDSSLCRRLCVPRGPLMKQLRNNGRDHVQFGSVSAGGAWRFGSE
jgi:hypothetical protein